MTGAIELIANLLFGASVLAVAHVLCRTIAPVIPRMIALLRGEVR